MRVFNNSRRLWIWLEHDDPHHDVDEGWEHEVGRGQYDYGFSPYEVDGVLTVDGIFEVK